MFSKKLPAHTIIWIPLAVWLVKSIVHGFAGKLGAYIHPRFFLFTIILCCVGLMLVVINLYKPDTHNHQHADSKQPNNWLASITILIGIATAMMPPITLSAASVVNRGNETFSAAPPTLSARYDQFNIKEWSGFLSQTHDPLTLVGKPVSLEGFLSKQPTAEKPGAIARFGVTCCAIDAQPVTLPIRLQDSSNIPINQWLKIKGVWQRDGASDSGISIKLNEVQQIPQPKEPYVY